MTLAELRRKAGLYAGVTSESALANFNAIIDVLLNDAMLRYSRMGKVPRTHELVSGVGTTNVTLGRTPLSPDGVLTVFDITNKQRLPVFTTYEADNTWPDRASASADKPKMVEWEHLNPTTLQVWPQPSPAVDLRITYAYIPQTMSTDDDQPWDGQLPEFHELIAAAAALDYAQRRIGEDSADLEGDKNPYGPLNAINTLSALVKRMEVDFARAAYGPITELPTADAWHGWQSPGYRYADPRLPTDI